MLEHLNRRRRRRAIARQKRPCLAIEVLERRMVLNSDANWNPATGELDVWHINTINARDNVYFDFIIVDVKSGQHAWSKWRSQ